MSDIQPIRTIEEVLNLETGEEIKACDFFLKPIDELFEYREELEKAFQGHRENLFVCYQCMQVVVIRGGKKKSANTRKAPALHFAHIKNSDECPIKTGSRLTQEEILRMKYNGAKESFLHKSLKNEIASRLRQNEVLGNGISLVEVEQTIKGTSISKEWKRPDINALYKSNHLAIELQLSTTFLSEIVKRQHFYQQESIYILWVFRRFEEIDEIRRFTDNDVIYSNNQNAFVYDEEAAQKSEQEKDLILKCYYNLYYCEGAELKSDWRFEFVKLEDFVFDPTSFKSFFHDSKKQKHEIIGQIQVAKFSAEQEITTTEAKDGAKEIAKFQRQEIRRIETEIDMLIMIKDNLEARLSIDPQRHRKISEDLKDLDSMVEKILGNITNQIFSTETFLRDFEIEYSVRINELNNSLKILLPKQANYLPVSNVEKVAVSGLPYVSIPLSHWSFIKANFDKIKVLYKNYKEDIFAQEELLTFRSQNEILRYQFNKEVYFLFPHINQSAEHDTQALSIKNEIISTQLTLTNIKGEITVALERTLKNEKEMLLKTGTHETLELIELDAKLGELENRLVLAEGDWDNYLQKTFHLSSSSDG